MKTTSIVLLASAALASAQVKYEDGKYVCEHENASYCAGDSLGTDIIIRCNGKVGQPGRCSDNLAGQPPLGNHPALCYQTSPTAGDAACEKNCVVYPASGNPFTLPADICTPNPKPEPTTTITFIHPAPSTSAASGEPTTTITFIHPAPSSSAAASGEPTTTITFIHPAPSSTTVKTVTTALVNPSQSQSQSHSQAVSSSTTRGVNGTQTGGGVKPPVHTGGAAAAAKGVAGAVAVVLGGAVAVWL